MSDIQWLKSQSVQDLERKIKEAREAQAAIQPGAVRAGVIIGLAMQLAILEAELSDHLAGSQSE